MPTLELTQKELETLTDAFINWFSDDEWTADGVLEDPAHRELLKKLEAGK